MRPGSASALRINGSRYSLRGAAPNLGSATNRLGTVFVSGVDLAGNVGFGGQAYITGSGHHIRNVVRDSSGGYYAVESTVGAGLLRVNYTGEVGIGTTSPSAKLDIAGNISIRNGVTPTEILLHGTYTSTTNHERLRIYGQTGGNFVIATEKGSAGGTRRTIGMAAGLDMLPVDGAAGKITFADTVGLLSSSITGGNGGTLVVNATAFRINVNSLSSANDLGWSLGNRYFRFLTTGNQSFQVEGQTTTTVPIFVKAGSGQTANLQEWRSSAGTPLVAVGVTGGIGVFGATPPAAKPATPATLADVISILQQYGLAA